MGRKFNTFILAVFLSGLAHCAYARVLVFGPEFFFSEKGKHQQVTKEFKVHDTDQKFMLSIQSGASGGKGIKAAITINGERVALPDEFRKRLMISKPVNLRNKNEISVETTGAADAPLLVTIINMEEEHTMTAEIPLLREALDFEGMVDFEGYAVMTFPNGSFSTAQSVTATLIPTPSTQYLFETDDIVPRLPYEIRINTGDKPPAMDVELSVGVPDSLIASDYAVQIFAMMHDNPDAPDLHDRFFKLSSGLNSSTNMLKVTLPRNVFSSYYGKNGTYEAVFTVGLIQ
ncbi:MAG: hypothetical protein KGL01_03040 [Betaproteobacteria bacterium]|nr:hypothetical protein [Betaproteobacteria bacterium]